MQAFTHQQLAPEQTGFFKGRGMQEQILNLWHLIEKSNEFNIPMFLCFVDYEKTDNEQCHLLWPMLINMSIPTQWN